MAPSARSQRSSRLLVHFAVVAVLVLVAFLRTRMEDSPAGSADSVQTVESPSTGTVTRAEGEDSDRSSTDGDDPSAGDRQSEHQKSTTEVNVAELPSLPLGHTGAADSRESGDEPPPGRLTLIADDVFQSTAGLIYKSGSRDGHRLKHILKHARDAPTKPVHGVFTGDREEILRWIDLAFVATGRGGSDVRQRQQRGRTAWTVRMSETIGYVGGERGAKQNHPACHYLRLVVESDGKTVVTAYPTSSF